MNSKSLVQMHISHWEKELIYFFFNISKIDFASIKYY